MKEKTKMVENENGDVKTAKMKIMKTNTEMNKKLWIMCMNRKKWNWVLPETLASQICKWLDQNIVQ